MSRKVPPPDEPVAEEQPVVEETAATEPVAKPAAKKAAPKKKPAKRKPAAKKTAAKAEKPADEPKAVPSAKEIKDQFFEAAVEPTKKAALVWADVVDVAKEGLGDLKDLAYGIGAGFLGNKKKDED